MEKKRTPPKIFIEDNNKDEIDFNFETPAQEMEQPEIPFIMTPEIVEYVTLLPKSPRPDSPTYAFDEFECDPRLDPNEAQKLKKTFSLFIPKILRSPLTPSRISSEPRLDTKSLLSPSSNPSHSKSLNSFLSINPATTSPTNAKHPAKESASSSATTPSTEKKRTPRKGSFQEEVSEEIYEACNKITQFFGFSPKNSSFSQEYSLQCLIFLEGLSAKFKGTMKNIDKAWYAKRKEFKAEAIRISVVEEKRILLLFQKLVHKIPSQTKYLSQYVQGVEAGWESCFDSTIDILLKLYSCVQFLRVRSKVLRKANGIKSSKAGKKHFSF